MKTKPVRTCYGCFLFYQDEPNGYAKKHCEYIDHYNDCPEWANIREFDLRNDKN